MIRFSAIVLAIVLAGCSSNTPTVAETANPPPAMSRAPLESWYLDYSRDEQSCLDQAGLLVLDQPDHSACWHLPGGVVDVPRIFHGETSGAWAAGTTVTGVLFFYGQAPTPSSVVIELRGDGEHLGETTASIPLMTPVDMTKHAVRYEFTTSQAIGASSALEFVLHYELPTVADYLVVGESYLILR